MPAKKCPVCRGPVLRRDVQTCGASECVEEWKSWSSNLRAKARIIANLTPAQYAQYLEDQAAEDKLSMRDEETDVDGESSATDTPRPDAMPQTLMANLSKNEPESPVLSEQEQRELRRKQMAEVLGVKSTE